MIHPIFQIYFYYLSDVCTAIRHAPGCSADVRNDSERAKQVNVHFRVAGSFVWIRIVHIFRNGQNRIKAALGSNYSYRRAF